MYPETWAGKLVASILVFVSMVYLALPMTIIVSKFNKAFEKFTPEDQRAKRLPKKKPSAGSKTGSGVSYTPVPIEKPSIMEKEESGETMT